MVGFPDIVSLKERHCSTVFSIVLYIKAQPLVEDAHTWQCTPDT